MIERADWSLDGCVVLLPWGAGSGQDNESRFDIEQLGAKCVHGRPPSKGYTHRGPALSEATHEFVPMDGVAATELPQLTPGDVVARQAQAHYGLACVFARHARPAFVPVVAPGADPAGRSSHYWGQPWMPVGMRWPSMDGYPMRFVLQLDTRVLPGPWGGRIEPGLLLFFHCDQGYSPDSQSCVVLVDGHGPGGVRSTPEGVLENPCMGIAAWREVADHPWDESMGVLDGFDPYTEVMESFTSTTIGCAMGADRVEYHEAQVVRQGIHAPGHCFECDKLGGWPRWEQGDETPRDSAGNPMHMFFQVGHEGLEQDNIDPEAIDWPTWGMGQIFYSPDTGEFTYVWACD